MNKRVAVEGQMVEITRGRRKGQTFVLTALLPSSGQAIVDRFWLYSLRSLKVVESGNR